MDSKNPQASMCEQETTITSRPTLYAQTLYLTETTFNAFANRADPDQVVLVRTT